MIKMNKQNKIILIKKIQQNKNNNSVNKKSKNISAIIKIPKHAIINEIYIKYIPIK